MRGFGLHHGVSAALDAALLFGIGTPLAKLLLDVVRIAVPRLGLGPEVGACAPSQRIAR